VGEFLAEAFDDRVDVGAVAEVFVAPDGVVEVLVGPDLARFLDEAVEEVVFQAGQWDLAVFPADYPAVLVEA
jgi:hypothetical protein